MTSTAVEWWLGEKEAWINGLITIGLWSSTLSFLAIGLFKHNGYSLPFDYYIHITMRKCLKVIIECWLSSIFYLSSTILLEMSSLRDLRLVDYAHRGQIVLMLVVYTCVVGCYLVTGEQIFPTL